MSAGGNPTLHAVALGLVIVAGIACDHAHQESGGGHDHGGHEADHAHAHGQHEHDAHQARGDEAAPTRADHAGHGSGNGHAHAQDQEGPPPLLAGTRGSEDATTHGRAISFAKEQQQHLPFDTALVERRTLRPTVQAAGKMTTPPDGRARVSAPVAGRVLSLSERSGPGTEVHAGQRLATLAPVPASPEEAARVTLSVTEARERVDAAQKAVERNETLMDAEAIPARELEEARRELRIAREALEAAKRTRRMYRHASSGHGKGTWPIRAPLHGTIASVEISPGESVTSGQTLFRLVDRSELWLEAHVPEQAAERMRPEAGGSYRIVGHAGWRSISLGETKRNAELAGVSPVVDSESRTVRVLYALKDAPPHVRVGAAVRMELAAGEAREAVAVPRNALVPRRGGYNVYVQRGDEVFEERTVEVGVRSGNWVEVRRGVKKKERVVVEGANLIRLASGKTTGGGHGHVH